MARASRCALLVALAAAAYVALFSFYCWRRYASFAEGDYDLGVFDQSFWTAARYGMPFFNTYENQSHFAFHWSPSLYLLLPVYALAPGAPTLLFLQTVALALGAAPAYLLGRDLVGPRTGVGLAVLYLLYFPLHGVNYHDFHEVSLVVAPLLFALWGLCTGRRAALWAGALLALAGREDMGLCVAGIGALAAWIALRARSGRDAEPLAGEVLRPVGMAGGLALAALGLAWTAASMAWIMPAFGEGPRLFHERLGYLGGDLTMVLASPLLRPAVFWGTLLSGTRVSYVLGLLGPLAFLPAWGWPLLLPAVPILLVNLMSSFGGMHLFTSHYAGPLIPFVFAAAAAGTRRLALRRITDEVVAPDALDAAGLRLMRPAFVLSILLMLAFDPSPLHLGRRPRPVDEHSRARAALVASLPPEASVSTQVNLWTRLVHRRDAWLGYHEGVDYILVDDRYPQLAAEMHLDDDLRPLLERGAYRLEREVDGVRVYHRAPLPAERGRPRSGGENGQSPIPAPLPASR